MKIAFENIVLRDMIGLAQKLGFRECNRYVGIRQVGGEKYDGLTFRVERKNV